MKIATTAPKNTSSTTTSQTGDPDQEDEANKTAASKAQVKANRDFSAVERLSARAAINSLKMLSTDHARLSSGPLEHMALPGRLLFDTVTAHMATCGHPITFGLVLDKRLLPVLYPPSFPAFADVVERGVGDAGAFGLDRLPVVPPSFQMSVLGEFRGVQIAGYGARKLCLQLLEYRLAASLWAKAVEGQQGISGGPRRRGGWPWRRSPDSRLWRCGGGLGPLMPRISALVGMVRGSPSWSRGCGLKQLLADQLPDTGFDLV